MSNLDGEALAEPRQSAVSSPANGVNLEEELCGARPCQRFPEPLESTSIHLIRSASPSCWTFSRRRTGRGGYRCLQLADGFEFHSIRDFIILHYKANNREGAFWKHCREMEVPDSLAAKMDLFRANGRIVRHMKSSSPSSVRCRSWGQGLRPKGYHPLADQLTPGAIGGVLTVAHKHAAHVAGQMVPHQDYINAHCAAPPLDIKKALP